MFENCKAMSKMEFPIVTESPEETVVRRANMARHETLSEHSRLISKRRDIDAKITVVKEKLKMLDNILG